MKPAAWRKGLGPSTYTEKARQVLELGKKHFSLPQHGSEKTACSRGVVEG